MKTKEEIEDELILSIIASVGNFGIPLDMYHLEYGQILKDGEPTEAGLKFWKDTEEFNKKRREP
jgi:hypothetical protein